MGERNTPKSIDQREYVKISSLQAIDNRLMVKLDFSDGIRKCFRSNKLFVEFDKNIEKTEKSILSIPPLSAVISVAWATGANVYVGSIEANFLASLRNVELQFKKSFPRFMFSTNVHVSEEHSVVSNKFANKQSALLFTGGVDSLSSYLKHRDEKPTLILIWGADIPTTEEGYWNRVRTRLVEFARQERVKIHFIKTNSREIVNENLMEKRFLGTRHWWDDVAHGLVLTGVSAPLLVNEFETLLIASTAPKSYHDTETCGSHLFLNTDVFFGNTRVVYDNYELTRHEKVRYILKNNPAYHPYLIVCYDVPRFYKNQRALNCGTCEKCLRTFTSLTLEGIDPGNCNFPSLENERIYNLTKTYLEHGSIGKDRVFLWKDIQRYAAQDPSTRGGMLSCAREFFKWFINFDISGNSRIVSKSVSEVFKYFYLVRCIGGKFAVRRLSDAVVRKLHLGLIDRVCQNLPNCDRSTS